MKELRTGKIFFSFFVLSLSLSACNFSKVKQTAAANSPTLDAKSSTYNRLASELFGPSCQRCHNSGRASGGVDLTSFAQISKGMTETGEALVASGRSSESALYTVIQSGAMPPRGNISAEIQALLACWIDKGALETGEDGCQENQTTKDEATLAESGAPVDSQEPAPAQPELPAAAENPAPESGSRSPTSSYPRIVNEILTAQCARCHNARRAKGGVNLENYETIMGMKFDNGDALVVPGQPEKSPLYTVIAEGIMPPRGPLSADLQELLRCWIAAGASETAGDGCASKNP